MRLKRCATHNVTYDVTMPQIIALIEQSSECRQFIKVIGSNELRIQLNHAIIVSWQ